MAKGPRPKSNRITPSFQAVQCPACQSTAMEVGESLVLESLKKSDIASLRVAGHVQLVRCLHGRCCNCGMVLDAIRQSIPLQWDVLICPRCQKSDHLKAEVQELDLSGSIYRFGVVITCTACMKVQTFAKLLKGLWSIARVKISLTGIEIEKSAKSA